MIQTNRPAVEDASGVAFDNSGTGIAASDLQAAVVELDGRAIFLRKMILEADYTVLAGYFAVWVLPRVKNTTRLRIEAGARLRAMG